MNHIEKDKKPHTHLILDISDYKITIQQLRYHFKKIFRGNQAYKLSVHKDISDKAFSYLFHHSEDQDKVIYKKNISEEYLEKILEINRSIKSLYKEEKREHTGYIKKLEEEVTLQILSKFSPNSLSHKISTPWGDRLITHLIYKHRYVSPFELTRIITKIQYNIAREFSTIEYYSDYIHQYYRAKKFEDSLGNPIPAERFSQSILNALQEDQPSQVIQKSLSQEEDLQEEE
ncbi:hypothetical protein [Shewanella sp.]|uniref:hypothetical protein n=1 Tax=Shewanella sp. TaxID=50422 RepID=UPI00404820B2